MHFLVSADITLGSKAIIINLYLNVPNFCHNTTVVINKSVSSSLIIIIVDNV